MVNFRDSKLIRPEKRFFFVVLFLMFYGNKKGIFCRDMGIGSVMFRDWMEENEAEALQYIAQFKDKVVKEATGAKTGCSMVEEEPIPTAQELKQIVLSKLHNAIKSETDPQKLANTLKVLDKYDKDGKEESKKKADSLYDELKKGAK